MKQLNMNYKIITKEYRKLVSSTCNLENSHIKLKNGVIYTLYSDKFNVVKVGFAENNIILEKRMLRKEFILLDKKKGQKKELNLIINTLNELGINHTGDLDFKYSIFLMRHLSTLGWPVGRSLYKQRKIKKELFCA